MGIYLTVLVRLFPRMTCFFTKISYGLTLDTRINEALKEIRGSEFIITGSEIYVCVLESTIGLIEMGSEVYLLVDCLFTAAPDPILAMRRLCQLRTLSTTLRSMAYE